MAAGVVVDAAGVVVVAAGVVVVAAVAQDRQLCASQNSTIPIHQREKVVKLSVGVNKHLLHKSSDGRSSSKVRDVTQFGTRTFQYHLILIELPGVVVVAAGVVVVAAGVVVVAAGVVVVAAGVVDVAAGVVVVAAGVVVVAAVREQ